MHLPFPFPEDFENVPKGHGRYILPLSNVREYPMLNIANSKDLSESKKGLRMACSYES